jgi:hypothetical protein
VGLKPQLTMYYADIQQHALRSEASIFIKRGAGVIASAPKTTSACQLDLFPDAG